MSLRKLHTKLDEAKDELYMLHFAEPSPELYKQKRHELEYKIACLEEIIELEERLKPFRVTLMVFVAIVLVMITVMAILK